MDERDDLPVEKFITTKPSREPDVILPSSEDHYEVHVWVAENIFYIDNTDSHRTAYLTRIKHSQKPIYNALEYLRLIADNEYQSEPRRIAAICFIVELELLK